MNLRIDDHPFLLSACWRDVLCRQRDASRGRAGEKTKARNALHVLFLLSRHGKLARNIEHQIRKLNVHITNGKLAFASVAGKRAINNPAVKGRNRQSDSPTGYRADRSTRRPL